MVYVIQAGQRKGIPPVGVHTVVTTSGQDILVDGIARKIYGVRTASATYNQVKTDHLIAQLDDYKSYGVRAVAVFMQGSSGGHFNTFNSTGTGWTDGGANMDRMKQIAQALYDRDMVLICGIFYTSASWETINSPDQLTAFTEACKLVTSEMAEFPNVILNIANEFSHVAYDGFFVANAQTIAAAMHGVNPSAIVGTGGVNLSHNTNLADEPDIDVLMMFTTTTTIGERYDGLRSNGVTKPILNIETFGNQSKSWVEAPGVFSDEWHSDTEPKGKYQIDIDECAARNVSSFFFDGRWMQPKSIGGTEDDMRFDMATPGDGSVVNPGWRWWAEYVQANGIPW